MRKTASTFFLLTVLSVGLAVVFSEVRVKAEHGVIVVPDDFVLIQAAVDHANDGDIVFVRNGDYYNQTVTVNKRLSLIGEDQTKTRIFGDWTLNGTVILVRHDGVTVQNLTMQSVENSLHVGRGVHLLHAKNCLVSNCTSMCNGVGVWLYGSCENTIENNQIQGAKKGVTPNSAGIKLQNSNANNITKNNVSDYYNAYGIFLSSSNRNILDKNQVLNNYYGITIRSSSNNIITSNTVKLTLNIFVANAYGVIIHNNAIEMQNSSNNIVTNNTISKTTKGIRVVSSYSNVIENNTINETRYDQIEYVNEEDVIPEFSSGTPMLITLSAVIAVALIYRSSLRKQVQRRSEQ